MLFSVDGNTRRLSVKERCLRRYYRSRVFFFLTISVVKVDIFILRNRTRRATDLRRCGGFVDALCRSALHLTIKITAHIAL